MFKHAIIGSGLALVSMFCYSQEKNTATLNSYVRNTILYQTLNDFDQNIPLFVPTPWLFFYTNVNHVDQNYFFKDNYYDNSANLKESDLLEKEIADLTHPCFVPYIPQDSNTTVRVWYKDRMLYEIKLNHDKTRLIFSQVSGNKKLSKEVILENGKPVSSSIYDDGKVLLSKTIVQCDSLEITELFNVVRNEYTMEECKYRSGNLYEKKQSRFITGKKPKTLKTLIYSYNSDNQPLSILTYGPKGRIKDSTNYLWHNSDLLTCNHFLEGVQDVSIIHRYSEDGLLVNKSILTADKKIFIDYAISSGKTKGFSFNNSEKNVKFNVEIEYDTKEQLAILEISKYSKEGMVELSKDKYLFSYRPDGNIQNIKVINTEGRIDKEILFEYSFFPTSK